MMADKVLFDEWLDGQMKSPTFKKAFDEEDVKARLALSIAQIRKKRKMTQGMLAKKIHSTQQMISDIESFKQPNITLSTLQKISMALGSRLVVELR